MTELVFKSEIRARLLGALVFVVRCAQQGGGNAHFIAGVLALAEHRALVEGLDWPGLLTDTRAALGSDVGALLDQALALESGQQSGV